MSCHKSRFICSSLLHLLLVLLFFEIRNSSQIPGRNTGAWKLRQNPVSSIRNGQQLDLSSYPDLTLKLKLSNSTILNTRSFFQNLEISFTVNPPDNNGIILVIQEMNLRRPYSPPSEELSACGPDYIQFNETRGNNTSGSICGTVSNRDESEKMLGSRTFVTGINKGIGVHFSSANGYLNFMERARVVDPINKMHANREIQVTLVFTAYKTGCFNETKFRDCNSGQNLCVSSNVFCDGNINCDFGANSTQSTDEVACSNSELLRTDTNLNTTRTDIDTDVDSDEMSIFDVIPESASTTPSSTNTRRTTGFPYWLLFPSSSTTAKPNPWINWNFNNFKTRSTTTLRPIIILTQYDYEPEPTGPGWARRLPAFQVVLIFISVVFLIFGTCTLLARMNTVKPNLFHGASSSTHSRRNNRMAAAEALNGSSAPGDVVIQNQGADHFNIQPAQSPPPRYHEVNELPPSYNTLFYKN